MIDFNCFKIFLSLLFFHTKSFFFVLFKKKFLLKFHIASIKNHYSLIISEIPSKIYENSKN